MFETITFRFLEWGNDETEDRWHHYRFTIEGDWEQALYALWPQLETIFQLGIDGGAVGEHWHFRIEHLNDDWEKASQLIATCRQLFTQVGFPCGPVEITISEEFEP